MLRYPRTRQPRGGAKPEIDWDNPLTRGLVGVVIPHIGELINHGTVSPRTNTHYLSTDISGIGLRDGGTEGSNNGWRYPGAWSRIAGDLSVFSFSRLTSIPGGSRREAGNFQGGTVQGSYCLVPNGTQFRMQYLGSGGASVQALGAAVDTKPHFHVGTVTASTVAIYTDGVLGGTIAAPGFGSAISGSDFEILGDSGGGFGAPAIIFMAGVYNRALSASEIAALARNPWQIFRPIVVPVKAASSGSSGTVNYTNANDTSSASGTTTVVGTSSATNANDTSSASGTTTVVGTSSTTNANDTSSASGTVGGDVSGTVSVTNANDTASASGWAGVVSGTVDYTNNDDTSSAEGSTPRTRRGAAKPLRKGYIIRGKKYFLTDDELAIMVALELETIKRSDIKVPAKGRIKPIPAATFQMVKAVAKKMDELAEIGALEDDDDEEEEILSMLL